MEQLPIYSTSVQSDDRGDWLQDIQGKIEPGIHRVVIEDDMGNQDEAMLYVVRDQPVILEQVTKIVPAPFAYGLSALFLVILVLAGLNVWLGRKADNQLKGGKRKIKRYLPFAIIISTIALLVTLVIGVYLNKHTNFVNQAKDELLGVSMPKIDVSGSIQTPFEHQGVSGLDLTVGDTSVRTVQGGRYVFSQIEQGAGIRLNHPSLKVSFVISVDKSGALDIPFDSDLYNAVFDIQQLEAQGKYGEIYDKLSDAARRTMERDGFIKEYSPAYGPSDIRNQEIFVAAVKELSDWKSVNGLYGFPQVIQMEVRNNAQVKTYVFTMDGGAWRLIK